MAKPDLHPFFELDETDRAHWLVAFLEDPDSSPPYEPPFPFLPAGESAATWVCDQFRLAHGRQGMADRIRRPVVELLKTGLAREHGRDRAQVLGMLLEIAGACAFSEIVPTLRAWIRSGKHLDASYRDAGVEVPMRCIVWSILIGWHETEDLVELLKRDFVHLSRAPGHPDELGRLTPGLQQLCFAELGRLKPEEAIRLIPDALRWPEPYWREVLHTFLVNLGPREALAERFHSAWTDCFSRLSSLDTEESYQPFDWPQFGFAKFLSEEGIRYRRTDPAVYLWLDEDPSCRLELSIAFSVASYESFEQDAKEFNQRFAEARRRN